MGNARKLGWLVAITAVIAVLFPMGTATATGDTSVERIADFGFPASLVLTGVGNPIVGFGDSVAECVDRSCCLLYTSPSPRDATLSRMPSSA